MSEITISLFSARSAAIDQFSGAACEAGLPLQLGFAAASRFGLGLAPKPTAGSCWLHWQLVVKATAGHVIDALVATTATPPGGHTFPSRGLSLSSYFMPSTTYDRTDPPLTALSRIGSVRMYGSDKRQAVRLSMLFHLLIRTCFGAAPSIRSAVVLRTR